MGCIPPFPIHIQTLVSHADAQTLAGSYINFPIAGSIICVGGLKPTLQDLLSKSFRATFTLTVSRRSPRRERPNFKNFGFPQSYNRNGSAAAASVSRAVV